MKDPHSRNLKHDQVINVPNFNHFDFEYPKYTPKGYRKRPSYQAVIDMVSLSLDSLKEEVIQKAFKCSGIEEKGIKVPMAELNHNLRAVLAFLEEGIAEAPATDNFFQGLEEEAEEDGEEEEVIEVDVVGEESEKDADNGNSSESQSDN